MNDVTPDMPTADVVVVGAGLSGLTAAYRLHQQGDSVVVLEASNRVGGRTVNLEVAPGVVVDGGGQWIGGKHTHMFSLLDELGLRTFDSFTAGRSIYLRRGKRSTYRGTIPPLKPLALADAAQAQARLEMMSRSVPVDRPWKAHRAVAWDGTTVGRWLDVNCLVREAREMFTYGFTTIFGDDPHRVSLLKALHMIRTSGGIDFMFNTKDGAQETRIDGGAQSISHALHERLGSRVILDSPVRGIVQKRGRVVVDSARANVECQRVVIAMTPADADRIAFTPTLPSRRAALQRHWHNGIENKVFFAYPTPFWRGDGLNGSVIADLPAAHMVMDSSPADGRIGILLAFVGTSGGGPGLGWSDSVLDNERARHTALIQDLTALFGPQAAQPLRIVEKNWTNEPWIAGCVSTRAPGLMTRYTDAAVTPVDRIHWAGTEAAPEFEGYLEGAVRAAERAVAEVSALLPIPSLAKSVSPSCSTVVSRMP